MQNSLKNLSIGCTIGVILTLLFTVPSFAGLGKIAGTVTDAESGDPLPGASVQIAGTTMGAATDAEGRYFILNIPPGRYVVKISYMGYATQEIENVRAQLDVTTEVNAQLKATVIEGETVSVVAERPMVENTLTATKSSIGAMELENTLPIADVNDLAETVASTYRGYIRGGRKIESKVIIDGVDISDTYLSGGTGEYGNPSYDVGHSYHGFRRSEEKEIASVEVVSSTISEMNVMAGTFNAEYPTASAGIYNYVTKSGGSKLSGGLFVRLTPLDRQEHFGTNVYTMRNGTATKEGYFDERDKYLADPDPAQRRRGELMTWTEELAEDKYNYDPVNGEGIGRSAEIEASLSGPIGDKLTFYSLFKYNHLRNPLPFDVSTHLTGNLKLNYNIAADKLLTGYFQLTDGGKLFNFVNWKFNPVRSYYMEGAPRYKDLGLVGYLKYTHTLSPKTFFEVQLSQNNKGNWVGYPDDNGDGYCDIDETGDFIEFKDMAEWVKYVGNEDGYQEGHYGDTNYRVFFGPQTDFTANESKTSFYGNAGIFRAAYPSPVYIETIRNVTTLKGDLTSQITYNHQLKAGFQFRRHQIDNTYLQTDLGGKGVTYPMSKVNFDHHEFNPMELAFYVQDRIEFQGMIVNVGVRVDGYDNDTERFKNDFYPYDYVTNEAGELVELRPSRGDKVGWNFFVSPRLGIAHPVSEKMQIHYAYGRFVQYPSFISLYNNYNMTNFAASPTQRVAWNDQDPINATSYELGVQYAISSDIRADVTAYYRDVDNYSSAGFTLTPSKGTGLSYTVSYGNADARGIEFSLEKISGSWWGARLAYAYSYIKASSGATSTGADQRTSFSSSADSANYAELPIENADNLNYILWNVLSSNTGNQLAGGFDRPHRVTGTCMFFFPYQFQLTATGEVTSGFYWRRTINVYEDPYWERNYNIELAPTPYHVNLRLTKIFDLGMFRLSAFGEVRNVTNHKDIRGISTIGSNPGQNQFIWELGRDGKPDTGDENDPEGEFQYPTDNLGRLLYNDARQFWVGFDVEF